MKEHRVFNANVYAERQKTFTLLIHNFDAHTRRIENGNRNTIKIVSIGEKEYNIKGFKLPNAVNQFVYRFFRKSKAERSFEFANKLLSLGIKTPEPIGYFEYTTTFLFKKSFYISEHLNYDLSFRELIEDKSYPAYEEILRLFTRFTFTLHENGVNFLDHSPGNTLIKRVGEVYEFYLVDLNRMRFHVMSFEDRMKNFAKLSPRDYMLDIMIDEYSKVYTAKTKDEIFERMHYYSYKFSTAYMKRERFKKKYFFWRKKKR
ncbi:lipopolysaccharide kinase InaA family protein [Gaetbulibacter jejuensis]|uniref:lipopolysaccharide kinase InaA family protein n=1 Tax=Gaetbulibacter jejuensis TaxID=584607 RepID=UPI0030093964